MDYPGLFENSKNDNPSCRSQLRADSGFEIIGPDGAFRGLAAAWENIIQSNLAMLAQPLVQLVTKQLSSQSLLGQDIRPLTFGSYSSYV